MGFIAFKIKVKYYWTIYNLERFKFNLKNKQCQANINYTRDSQREPNEDFPEFESNFLRGGEKIFENTICRVVNAHYPVKSTSRDNSTSKL